MSVETFPKAASVRQAMEADGYSILWAKKARDRHGDYIKVKLAEPYDAPRVAQAARKYSERFHYPVFVTALSSWELYKAAETKRPVQLAAVGSSSPDEKGEISNGV